MTQPKTVYLIYRASDAYYFKATSMDTLRHTCLIAFTDRVNAQAYIDTYISVHPDRTGQISIAPCLEMPDDSAA